MHAELERLIRLQVLDHEIQSLKHLIETESERRQAIEGAVVTKRALVEGEREKLKASQHERREIEKELAQVQTRLSRYRDQLMAVKTNKEYHAMQHEIETAESEVRTFEDKILEHMLAGDDLAAQVKAHEAELRDAEADAQQQRRSLTEAVADAHRRIAETAAARKRLTAEIPRDLLENYETLLARRGSAVVEAQGGHCSVCHVRLRPKVDQDVRRNDSIIHCDSCQRILYYAVHHATAPPATPPPQHG